MPCGRGRRRRLAKECAGIPDDLRDGGTRSESRIRNGLSYQSLYPHWRTDSGMAYLIRRLLENTFSESFLKRSFRQSRHRTDAPPGTRREFGTAPGLSSRTSRQRIFRRDQTVLRCMTRLHRWKRISGSYIRLS